MESGESDRPAEARNAFVYVCASHKCDEFRLLFPFFTGTDIDFDVPKPLMNSNRQGISNDVGRHVAVSRTILGSDKFESASVTDVRRHSSNHQTDKDKSNFIVHDNFLSISTKFHRYK